MTDSFFAPVAKTGKTTIPRAAWDAFRAQRNNARRRSIPFLFTFAAWWAWWQVDDRWLRRGVGKDCLVMARKSDKGPYSPENVVCITAQENVADAAKSLDGTDREQRRARLRAAHASGCYTYAHLRRGRHPASKRVRAPDGRTWPSTSVAAEELGLTRQAIAIWCRKGTYGWALAYVLKAYPGMIEKAARALLLELWRTARVRVVSARSMAHMPDAPQARRLDQDERLLERSYWRRADLERELPIIQQPVEEAKPPATRWIARQTTKQPAERRLSPARTSMRGYHQSDPPLVQEMREHIAAGRARNPWDASAMVVDRAVGHGTEESSRKRLCRLFYRTFPEFKSEKR